MKSNGFAPLANTLHQNLLQLTVYINELILTQVIGFYVNFINIMFRASRKLSYSGFP